VLDTLKQPLRRKVVFCFETHAMSSTASIEEGIIFLPEETGTYTRDRLHFDEYYKLFYII
jgi:hypothetical protein